MSACIRRELRSVKARLDGTLLRLKLVHPGIRLSQQAQKLDELEQRLAGALGREMRTIVTRMDSTVQRLRLVHPGVRLEQQVRRLDGLGLRLDKSVRATLQSNRNRLSDLRTRLVQHSPDHLVREYRLRHESFDSRLRHAWKEYGSRKEHRLSLAVKTLNTASPLATFARGFAMVTRPDGTLVRDAASVSVGDEIEARLAQGRLKARVTGKE
jgi:exodeoxyribonuclease VII large subunit